MQRFEPSIDLDFANGFCEKKKKLSTEQLRLWICSALLDEATGHRRNAAIRAGGHLGGRLGFAKLILGALASTQGASRKRKKFRLRSFEPALVLQTERLHIYNGLCRPEASYTVNMQSFERSHGTP